MPGKRYKPQEIVANLRQVDVLVSGEWVLKVFDVAQRKRQTPRPLNGSWENTGPLRTSPGA